MDVGAPLNLKNALVHFKKVKIDSKGVGTVIYQLVCTLTAYFMCHLLGGIS